jgi:hypothetical protein
MGDALTHFRLRIHDVVGADPFEDASVRRRYRLGPEDADLDVATDGDDGLLEPVCTDLSKRQLVGGVDRPTVPIAEITSKRA